MLYLPLLLAVSMAKDSPNCVGAAHCDPGATCCQDTSRAIFYGCCAESTPVCCSDHVHCCPIDYPICDPAVGGCVNAAGDMGMPFGVRGGATQGFLRVPTRGAMMPPASTGTAAKRGVALAQDEVVVAAADDAKVKME